MTLPRSGAWVQEVPGNVGAPSRLASRENPRRAAGLGLRRQCGPSKSLTLWRLPLDLCHSGPGLGPGTGCVPVLCRQRKAASGHWNKTLKFKGRWRDRLRRLVVNRNAPPQCGPGRPWPSLLLAQKRTWALPPAARPTRETEAWATGPSCQWACCPGGCGPPESRTLSGATPE